VDELSVSSSEVTHECVSVVLDGESSEGNCWMAMTSLNAGRTTFRLVSTYGGRSNSNQRWQECRGAEEGRTEVKSKSSDLKPIVLLSLPSLPNTEDIQRLELPRARPEEQIPNNSNAADSQDSNDIKTPLLMLATPLTTHRNLLRQVKQPLPLR
jgi:hypothetical protein